MSVTSRESLRSSYWSSSHLLWDDLWSSVIVLGWISVTVSVSCHEMIISVCCWSWFMIYSDTRRSHEPRETLLILNIFDFNEFHTKFLIHQIIRIWKQQRNGYFFQTSFMIMLLLLKHKFLQFRTWWHLWVLRDKILIKLFNYIYIYILYWACYRHFSVDNEAHVHENIQITLSNFIWSNILNVI